MCASDVNVYWCLVEIYCWFISNLSARSAERFLQYFIKIPEENGYTPTDAGPIFLETIRFPQSNLRFPQFPRIPLRTRGAYFLQKFPQLKPTERTVLEIH